MLYSRSKNFVFIHIPKTAGTSIRSAINSYKDSYNKRGVLGKFARRLGMPQFFAPNEHISAFEAKKLLGDEVWDNAYTFAVVRNPWDLEASMYAYMIKSEDKLISKMKSFDEYIVWRCEAKLRTQSQFLKGDSGDSLIVKDIYRFESLDSDIQRLGSYIGCNIRLQVLNQSRSDSYQKYYSDKSRDMVSRFSKEDIDRFGYEF